MKPDYGLPDNVIDEVAKDLKVILADTQVLYVKSLNYHWNMEDGRFYFLHRLIQEQYEALAEFTDEVAEKIRQMGQVAPGSLKEFLELATLHEARTGLSANEMLTDLAESHEAVVKFMRKAIDTSTELGDVGTADMLTEALRGHEKNAWLLRSHL